MTKTEAHELLNAAQSGLMVSSQSITEALVVTGDLSPCQRRIQERMEVTQAVPTFSQEPARPERAPKPVVVIPPLPKLVHKPFEVVA